MAKHDKMYAVWAWGCESKRWLCEAMFSNYENAQDFQREACSHPEAVSVISECDPPSNPPPPLEDEDAKA